MDRLEKQFDEEMMSIYRRAKSEARYTAIIFFDMLNRNGGLATAKYLINSPKVSDGYTALYERGCLHLTVEAVVIENTQWHRLFTPEELEKARKRLVAYQYKFR
ncbi:hypothetical protein [Ancylobacter sp. G4_0304]|uniref:hypothetical protein n=1 Tax=Ancylobacter sp. G4_0304 TaxID=3114289 RepID=UPI0039C6EC72